MLDCVVAPSLPSPNMGGCCGKKKKKEGEEDDDEGACAITPNQMKLITLFTLLTSDFDMVFTSADMCDLTLRWPWWGPHVCATAIASVCALPRQSCQSSDT